MFKAVIEGDFQSVKIKWFGEIIVCAVFDAFNGIVDIGKSRHHNNRNGGIIRMNEF